MRGDQTVILFEGNIAAGKSTVGRRLKASGLFEFVEEPVGAWQKEFASNLLEMFYADPHRWAFTFQLAAFTTRAKTWSEVIALSDHSRVVLERSIFCDRNVFAKNCYQSGLISETEWQLYCHLWEWVHEQWNVEPDIIVYLRTPAEICLQRIDMRGRSEENTITLEYLQDLEALHDEWLLNEPGAVVLDGEQFWTGEAVKEALEQRGLQTTFSFPKRG